MKYSYCTALGQDGRSVSESERKADNKRKAETRAGRGAPAWQGSITDFVGANEAREAA
jgi:hypothetical protein